MRMWGLIAQATRKAQSTPRWPCLTPHAGALTRNRGEPEAEVRCGRSGELKLAALEIAAWQALELVRKWSDTSRRADKGVEDQLSQMFARVKAALGAWAELTIELQDVN